MRFYSGILGIVITCAMVAGVSCKKDDDSKKDTSVVTSTGLAMNGAQEVPAKTTNATGTVNVSYNKTTHALDFTINWSSLTGVPTGAHMHGPAAKGVNAGIVFDFFDAFPSTTSGTYTSSTTVDGTKIIEDSLLAGKYYFNIHTAANPAGEIRAQVEF